MNVSGFTTIFKLGLGQKISKCTCLIMLNINKNKEQSCYVTFQLSANQA